MILAQEDIGVNLSDPSVNPLAKFDSIATFMNVILPFTTIIGAVAFLFMLLYGAFTFITAGGDAENMKKAQKTFGFSIIGLFIMVFAYFFVRLLSQILNISSPLP